MSSKTISPSFNNLDLLLEAFASHQKQTGNTAEKFHHDEKFSGQPVTLLVALPS